METKDLTLKLLNLPDQEKKLLKGHLSSSNELSSSVIEGDFCEKACPQKREHGEAFNWGKHCGCYLGERSCNSLKNYEDFYRSLKNAGVDSSSIK